MHQLSLKSYELLRQYASQACAPDNLQDCLQSLVNGEYQINVEFDNVWYTVTISYKNKFSLLVDLFISLFNNDHQIEFRKISVAPLHQIGKFN